MTSYTNGNFLAATDISGGGQVDVVWQDQSSGPVEILFLDGGAPIVIANNAFDAGWSVVATGDFNGDGNTDLVWQNQASGLVEIQLFNGTTVIGGGLIANNAFGAGWSVVATGDFNGDGNTDLLWQNQASGLVEIQLFNGTTVIGGGVVANNAFGAGWSVVATGDFNGDGNTDLVWQNQASGLVEIQLFNGTTVIGGGVIANNAFGTGWSVVATGDFNGDGKTNLVWQNQASGLVEIQLLDGNTAIGGGVIANNAFGTGWSVVATGDFNGDGKTDLVWQNQASGLVEIQLLDGTTAIGGGVIGVIPPAPLAPSVSWSTGSASGVEGSAIALGTLSDTINGLSGDGNTLQSLTLAGIPVGATLADGTHSFTAATGSTSVNVAGWNLSSLTVMAASAMTFSLSATATEQNAAGTISSASAGEAVSVAASGSSAWPDLTNTGVPSGTVLTPAASNIISSPGTYNALSFNGTVTIASSNVTLANCQINGNAGDTFELAVGGGLSNVVIQNSTINGAGTNSTVTGAYGIYIMGDSQVTINASNIANVGSGLVPNGQVLIENSYIHNLNSGPGSHYNGIQYNGGAGADFSLDIEHNTIVDQQPQTDAIMLDTHFGGVNNVTINNNILAGGSYPLYAIDDGKGSPTNIAITNNHMVAGSSGWSFDFAGANYATWSPNSLSGILASNPTDGATLLTTMHQ